MADRRAECQRFLTEFRVLELKELLRAIGLSQRGRKSDLFQRANQLLIHGSPKIQQHIQAIYSKSHSIKRPKFGKMVHSQGYSHMKGMMQHHTPNSQLGGSGSTKTEKPDRSDRSYILHPDVKFKPHPFYKLKDLIIRPTTLVSTGHTSSGSSSMLLQFHLTPQQVQLICASRTTQGYGIQILLRFARNETSCEQEDFYPKQCYVKVNNNSYCTLPGYNPHLSVRPDYKRYGSPVNITELVKTSPSKTNDVIFYWSSDILYPQGFCVEISLVKSLSSSDLLQELKLRPVRSPEVSRALVREKLAVDRDSEISATSLRVSLLCPLGKLRMTHPCRSQMCTHLQCFDASIYLQMNERKARWVCPVCDKSAPADSLVVDGLFKEICAESTFNDIEFYSDGSWHQIGTKDVPTHRLTPERKLDSLSPVTISDSVDADSPADVVSIGRGTLHNPIVIDEDESEEEQEEEMEEDHIFTTTAAATTTCSTSIISPRTHPSHIIDPSHSSAHHHHHHHHRRHDNHSPHDHVYRDGVTRSVIVKRRFSSTTDGGAEVCSDPLITPITSHDRYHHHQQHQNTTTTATSTSASTTSTAPPIPVPVITEYAPTLPYCGPLLPYLAQQRTVLASSDNTLVSSGGDHINIDDLHLPSLSGLDDSIFTFIQQSRDRRLEATGITLVED